MKPAGLKITKPRNSTDHRSGLSLSVARGNSYQVWWAPDAFGLIRKKEETLALNPEENAPQEHGKTVVFKPADLRGFRNDADTAPSAPSAPSPSPASPASPAHRGPDSGSLFGARHARRTARGFSAKTRTRAAYPTPPRTSAPAIRVPTRTATRTAIWTATRASAFLEIRALRGGAGSGIF